MNEHPILFSAPMIRAILDGRKTVTRRVIKANYQFIEERDDGSSWPWREDLDHAEDHWYPCPYGKPGDTLWVRETWAHVPTRDAANHVKWHGTLYTPRNCIYRADDPKLPPLRWGKEGFEPFKWAPSIFMPRWASRITLRIKSVRVERLQDISEDDAVAEGIEECGDFFGCPCWKCYDEPADDETDDDEEAVYADDPVGSFRSLWNSINRKRGFGWNTNPWVWAISFERVEPVSK